MNYKSSLFLSSTLIGSLSTPSVRFSGPIFARPGSSRWMEFAISVTDLSPVRLLPYMLISTFSSCAKCGFALMPEHCTFKPFSLSSLACDLLTIEEGEGKSRFAVSSYICDSMDNSYAFFSPFAISSGPRSESDAREFLLLVATSSSHTVDGRSERRGAGIWLMLEIRCFREKSRLLPRMRPTACRSFE